MPGRDWIAAAGVLWPLLTQAAAGHRTVTYSQLAPAISTNPLSVGYALGPIQDHCLSEGLPPLTSLVVRKDDHRPGAGFIAGRPGALAEDQERVFAFAWATVANPFVHHEPARTYLLTWNPTRWQWTSLLDDVKRVAESGGIDDRWSSGNTKRINPGDRLFLLRQGLEPRGIMGSGHAASTVYQGASWDPHHDTANYVDLRFDALLDPLVDGVLPLARLHSGPLAGVNWNTQSSGISIDDAAAARLEELWLDFLEERELATISPPEEVTEPERYIEGALHRIVVNAYERDGAARDACIREYGAVCRVCDFDFEAAYGALGRGYIHVHHVKPLADIGEEYAVDPLADLVPVCANCHAMLHRPPKVLSVADLRSRMREAAPAEAPL